MGLEALVVDAVCSVLDSERKDVTLIFHNERLVSVGPYTPHLDKKLSVTRQEGIVTPGFVNAHMHLELSELQLEEKRSGLTEWYSRLVTQLKNTPAPSKELLYALQKAGTVAIGDISTAGSSYHALQEAGMLGIVFLEFFDRLGRDKPVLPDELNLKHDELLTMSLAPHALYSASPSLVQSILERNKTHARKTSIHYKEDVDEVRFYEQENSTLLQYFQKADSAFPKPDFPYSFVETFQETLTDSTTLLVHNTYVTEQEISTFAKKHVPLVLCPRSNLFIGGALPPVSSMLAKGAQLCLGTDSLASNHSLDVRDEAIALHNLLGIPEIELLYALTYGGAQALGILPHYGLHLGAHRNSLVHTREVRSQQAFQEHFTKLQYTPLQHLKTEADS